MWPEHTEERFIVGSPIGRKSSSKNGPRSMVKFRSLSFKMQTYARKFLADNKTKMRDASQHGEGLLRLGWLYSGKAKE